MNKHFEFNRHSSNPTNSAKDEKGGLLDSYYPGRMTHSTPPKQS